MSKQHPFILYVGEDDRRLASAVEERGWYILLPHDELEALAMYSVYFPDFIILDNRVDFANEVNFHLTSVGTVRLFWLEDIQPANATAETLVEAIAALLTEPIPA